MVHLPRAPQTTGSLRLPNAIQPPTGLLPKARAIQKEYPQVRDTGYNVIGQSDAAVALPIAETPTDIGEVGPQAEDQRGYGANQRNESDDSGGEDEADYGDDGNLGFEELFDEVEEEVMEEEEMDVPNVRPAGQFDDGDDEFDEDYLHTVQALDSFGYGILSSLSRQEAISLALFCAKIKSKSPRQGYQEYQDIVDSLLNERPMDIRTIHKLLERKTGIRHVQYQVCDNNCYCYAEKPDAESCPECGTPRRKAGLGRRKTFECIDLIHLLRLRYSDPSSAAQYQVYVNALHQNPAPKVHRDIWDGKLMEELRRKGMFLLGTDLAFLCSTDGVNLFRKGISSM